MYSSKNKYEILIDIQIVYINIVIPYKYRIYIYNSIRPKRKLHFDNVTIIDIYVTLAQ